MADHGVAALHRGLGRVESGLGEAIETGIPVDASGREVALRLAGKVGRSIGIGIGRGVREQIRALTAPRLSGEAVTTALNGGPLPERISLSELRHVPEWRAASRTAQVSFLARMVARQDPSSMPRSREFIANVRRIPIDEEQLRPQTRKLWREALAMADREHRTLDAVGEYRQGYGAHADYASLGRVKAMLETIGAELALKARMEAATAAPRPQVAPEPAVTPAAADDAPWQLMSDDASAGLDETLEW
jgi:hypothetical protein